MDKKLVALALIAMLGGLGGGYVLGYTIYQPQILSLQNNINSLEDEIDNINSALGNTQSSISDLEGELDTVNSNFADTQSSINELMTELGTMNLTLGDLQSSLNLLSFTLGDLQSSLNLLNSEIANLDTTVEGMANRTWHEVYAVAGSSDIMSGLFQLKGSSIRMMWGASSGDWTGWLHIQLHFSNGTLYSYYASSGIWTINNCDEMLMQAGQYYLNITAYQTSYAVSLWDYY